MPKFLGHSTKLHASTSSTKPSSSTDRGSRVKSLFSGLYCPSDLMSELSSLPDPKHLIENKPTGADPDELLKYVRGIRSSRVREVAIESPLEKATKISKKLGVNFYIKREDKQPTFSFKIRGAYNMMSKLSKKELAKGVITASGGNHAQGVAFAAQKLKCHATIVMPTTTPKMRIEAVKSLGAHVIYDGKTFDESLKIASDKAAKDGLKFIHPYDDPEIIEGQGTVGMEIDNKLKDIYAVFVPVGGGGLIAGIAAYFKKVAPNTKIIGVEPYGAASMTLALLKGEPVKLKCVDNFADGVAVAEVGVKNFELCQQLVDGMVLMHRDGISAGLKDMYDEGRNILETSGALSIAGAQAYCKYYGIKDKNIVAIASGANMDFSKLKLVSELAEIGAGNEALLATVMPEEAGSLLKFVELWGSCNITEFTYRTHTNRKALALYSVDINADDPSKIEKIIKGLNEARFFTVDLSHHDLAKEHLRHLVVGGAATPRDQIFCQFIFPEIPGALKKFLKAFWPPWNITLFRYRDQGEMDSNVLVGFQVPQSDMEKFKNKATKLGYPYEIESLDEDLKKIVELSN